MAYLVAPSGEAFESKSPEWHAECKQVTKAEYKAARTEYLRSHLQQVVESANRRVYTMIRHVASSGMSRRLSVFVVEDGKIREITGLVAELVGYKRHSDGTLTVGGCGFDAGFDVVYNLGATIWPNGTPQPHGTRNGVPDSAGGYALKHERL